MKKISIIQTLYGEYEIKKTATCTQEELDKLLSNGNSNEAIIEFIENSKFSTEELWNDIPDNSEYDINSIEIK